LEGSFVLEVTSNVRGVVTVDGEPVGVTPFTGLVPKDTSEIAVSRKGYKTWKSLVAAQGGSRLVLKAKLRHRYSGERPDRIEKDVNASPFMDLMEMKIDE
jgi:hypothetical protein